ncbi:Uncharacterised protein [Yersinia pekkanenii]|uniref:Uncharacterized protein n=1 Tax=Yersinia pekkanenii TaxID=1288385 RepID=A0A0T9REW5_9GAMM|nr:Uncharacterised protein [Yersinia pekkanenii]CRY66583.1 Uncharacterised protein [Yersinia pekkanenii]
MGTPPSLAGGHDVVGFGLGNTATSVITLIFHLCSETFRWRSQFHQIGFAFCCRFSKLLISETFRCWSRK